MQKRQKFLLYLFIFIWCCLLYRLFSIQIFRSDTFTLLSKNQHFREEILPASRGNILDRLGRKLATDLAYYEFSAEPPRLKDPWKVATVFAQYSEKSRDYFLKILQKDKKFVFLDRKVPALDAEKIIKRNLKGVNSTASFKRFYPQGSITGVVTGFTNIDNAGIEGLEYKYDTFLAGLPGKRIVKTDALGNKNTDFSYPVQKPVNGNSIITTLDLDCQTIVVEELSKAMKQYNAVSATAILLEPQTGEIIAMVALPEFDSNDPQAYSSNLRMNRSINNTFEPGSIFKLVAAAAALEKGLLRPDDMIFCENGAVLLGNRVFRDSKSYGMLSFRDVIVKSSNIGTYKVAKMVGEKALYDYARKFGFGTKTGVDLGGESPGILRPVSRWSSHSLASIAIGQEMTVNALQIVSAFAAVANGGLLMKPYIVKAIISPSGEIVKEYGPQKVRRVISKNTAEILTDFFEGVVETGTAKEARIPGSSVAGKTGTAQKVDPGTKKYSETDYLSSFVAYYPSKNPKIAGIVVLDSPKGIYYGGHVAGPVMKNILTRITYNPRFTLVASFAPVNDDKNDQKGLWNTISNIWGGSSTRRSSTKNDLELTGTAKSGMTAREASNNTVTIPVESGTGKNGGFPVMKEPERQVVTVPDVRGMTIRRAMIVLTRSGLDFEISGSGYVAKQSHAPGKQVSSGTVLHLTGRIEEKYLKNREK